MNLMEYQHKVADALNADQFLRNGGCTAFCEDTRTVYDEARQHIAGGGVAAVVCTPSFTRNGGGGRITLDGKLDVRCVERPPLASDNPATIRALDAAFHIGKKLDGEIYNFDTIRQTSDTASGVITATATFNVCIAI